MHFMAQWSVDRESACHCASHPGCQFRGGLPSPFKETDHGQTKRIEAIYPYWQYTVHVSNCISPWASTASCSPDGKHRTHPIPSTLQSIDQLHPITALLTAMAFNRRIRSIECSQHILAKTGKNGASGVCQMEFLLFGAEIHCTHCVSMLAGPAGKHSVNFSCERS